MLNSAFVDEGAQIRRTRVGHYAADLDLTTGVVSVFHHERGRSTGLVGRGRWIALPEPLGDLRGRIVLDGLDARTCAMLECSFGRGNPAWSYDEGPWVAAEHSALAAGIGDYEAEMLRKVMWMFYRQRWPLKFAATCGWGERGPDEPIAAALADPERACARWELLILTGGLQWPVAEGCLDEVEDFRGIDDFYELP